MPPSVYDFEAVAIDGTSVRLDRYVGQVLLVVNVASRCGFTPQYRGLEALYRAHHERGFSVLGFPSNQFGAQEPAGEDAIQAFCSERYGVTFPLFAKIDVNGAGAHPLFVFLKARQRGWLGSATIKWNFTKFLVDRRGQPIRRFAPRETPETIEPAIRQALDASSAGRPS